MGGHVDADQGRAQLADLSLAALGDWTGRRYDFHWCIDRVGIPFFPAGLPHFSAKLTISFRKPECAHFGPYISLYGGYNSAVEGAMA